MYPIVTESSEKEFKRVAGETSQFRAKRQTPFEYKCKASLTLPVNASDYVSLKMRGLPFEIKREDVHFFFGDYKIFTESIKIGRNHENKKTGEAALLFHSEEECKRAFREKQGQNIGHRWIELF